ncbi:hypothetical protein SISNIDRAFT_460870 [Sistotremastrum niveocremeum HHB9708]|uniref:Uncharacterized protein n=1 Tax=Sistotremastrum niveocremeum HHB9708 TaxID=1314777 RepID=A0A164N903_9AGAM|nr:hypothetical protein SISNIDRAFT_460870 [Sistotremastrum niveocremeum HHB9708]
MEPASNEHAMSASGDGNHSPSLEVTHNHLVERPLPPLPPEARTWRGITARMLRTFPRPNKFDIGYIRLWKPKKFSKGTTSDAVESPKEIEQERQVTSDPIDVRPRVDSVDDRYYGTGRAERLLKTMSPPERDSYLENRAFPPLTVFPFFMPTDPMPRFLETESQEVAGVDNGDVVTEEWITSHSPTLDIKTDQLTLRTSGYNSLTPVEQINDLSQLATSLTEVSEVGARFSQFENICEVKTRLPSTRNTEAGIEFIYRPALSEGKSERSFVRRFRSTSMLRLHNAGSFARRRRQAKTSTDV